MSDRDVSQWLLGNNRYAGAVAKEPAVNWRNCKTISVTGGKGGVGKTSVSIKVAKLLAEAGNKVLLIDCDYNLSNTHIELGLPLSNNIYSFVVKQVPFEECLYKDGNFHLLSGCNGDVELFSNGLDLDKIVINILIEQERNYDYIVLDCPAGIAQENLTINAYTDYRFVVITPDKSSITDSYALMKILKTKYGVNENHLIINKVSSVAQYQRMVKIISDTVDSYLQCRLHILGNIFKNDQAIDLFDSILLSAEKNSLDDNFRKVVGRFTEELEATGEIRNDYCAKPVGSEQNVHHVIS